MISLKILGLLIVSFLFVIVLSRLIISRIVKNVSPRWVPYCYAALALIPLSELITMLIKREFSAPFFVFWLLFFLYCAIMVCLSVRKPRTEPR